MKPWWLLVLGVAFGLLAGGVIWLASAPPRGEAITLLPPPTPASMKIHVSGAVTNPGVYSLSAGSRVQDAIRAAGGISTHGDAEALNLAASLVDGEKVHIPEKSQNLDSSPNTNPSEAPENQPNQPQSSTTENLIDINTASQSELEELSGIGPVIAQRIIDYRETSGPFESIEDIQKVSGIGPVTFEKIKNQITVDGKP
ncbi:MAG: helix-hairpin-helix domain-containing protein [Anaerolineales bacterium]|jgi:competence protein ComEA